MGLDELKEVDAIGVERDSGAIVLSIVDSWDWEDAPVHLEALATKINAYLGFVEAGELLSSYPDAKARNVVIDIVGRYPIPSSADAFIASARDTAEQYGVQLRTKLIP